MKKITLFLLSLMLFAGFSLQAKNRTINTTASFPDAEIASGNVLTLTLPAMPVKSGAVPVLRLDILATAPRASGCNFLVDFAVNGKIIKMETASGSCRLLNRKDYILRGSGIKKAQSLYSAGGKLFIPFGPDFESADKVMTDNAGTQFLLDVSDIVRPDRSVRIQVRNLRGKSDSGYDKIRVRNVRAGYLVADSTPVVQKNAVTAIPEANIINVKSFGAVGDGVADDTAAIQKAIDAAMAPNGGGLFIPAGKYRITSTLFLRKTRIMHIYGQGDSVYNAKSNRSSTLFWDGPDGGTLIKAEGFGNVYFERLNLSGRAENKPKSAGEAGILFHSISLPGYGSGWSTFRNVSLHKAKIGFVMGGDNSVDMCNSDMQFYSIGMYELGIGFQTRNTQALNFIFNYINAANCGTVLDFKAGGNLEVHNATLSVCDRYLNIEMGGRCIGTYVNINVRLENRSKQRTVLVRSYPSYCQANIKFINFDDSQVGWPQNTTPTRSIPLCDIGPGSCVTIENSLFNGVVARINGKAEAPASLILRECSFGWLLPENAISANQYGYFQVINPMTDLMRPLPDLRKWPDLTPKTFPANGTHQAVF